MSKFIHKEIEVNCTEVSFEEFLKLDVEVMTTWDDENGRSIDLYAESLSSDGLLERVATIKPNDKLLKLFPDKFNQRFVGAGERMLLLQMEEHVDVL